MSLDVDNWGQSRYVPIRCLGRNERCQVIRKMLPLGILLLAYLPGQTKAFAQGANVCEAGEKGKLACLIPNLYGAGGLSLSSDVPHLANFSSDFLQSFTPFNVALANQLTSLPLPSPASGFTYTLDPTLGVYERSARSFGPILAERAETIGKNKFHLGFGFQRFSFDSIDGAKLSGVPSVFQHAPIEDPSLSAAEKAILLKDFTTTQNAIGLTVDQFTGFATFGLGNRLDVSVAIPFLSIDLDVVSDATIQRIGTKGDPTIHFFPDAPGDRGRKQFAASRSARGIGDTIFRMKGTVANGERTRLALGLDVRAPTGDEYNFLGSGAVGVKPFLVLSLSFERVGLHLNIGYQWNGKSVLAGNVETGEKSQIPAQVPYAAGMDIRVTNRLTVALDVIGQYLLDSDSVVSKSFTASNGANFPDVAFEKRSYNVTNAAIGFKLNPFGKLLIVTNLLFKLNDNGLRDRVTPLVGISYTP